MHFDDFLEIIGPFGRFQKKIYFVICLAAMMDAFHSVIVVFILGNANHRCRIPDFPGDTYEIQSEFHRQLINVSIPSTIGSYGNIKYDSCDRYIVNISDIEAGRGQKVQCDSWVYDKSIFKATFTTENDLVCDKTLWGSTASMMFFLGLLVGDFSFGVISDRFGRKRTLCFSLSLLFISTMSLAFARDFYLFCVLRFLTGIASSGNFLSGFVIGVEIVTPSKRITTGTILGYAYALGLVILAGLAYAIRHWKYLAIACSCPVVLILLFLRLIPESPRWLINKNRREEAKVILRKMAKENRVIITENQMDDIKSDRNAPSGHVKQLFTRKILLIRTLVIMLNWIAVGMVYFGLSLGLENLSGDLFLNFLLSGLVDFPAYTLCFVLLDRTGRRKFHVSCMVLCGLACICTIFTFLYLDESLQPITVALAMLGKLVAAAGFVAIIIWGAEIFPTCVRQGGMGISASSGGVGNILSPYIADLSNVIDGNLGHALPMAIFGGITLLAGGLSLFLPETMGQRLPETIEDGVNLGKKKTRYIERANSVCNEDSILTDQTKI